MMSNGQFAINVLALLLSPLIAVQVTEWINRGREKRQRRLDLFKTLMRTRAAFIAPDYVQALNLFGVEFHGKDANSQNVLRCFKALLNHLNTQPPATEWWGKEREKLLLELILAMGKCLDYDLDKTELTQTSYFPRGYIETELEQQRIRKGFADIVDGNRPLPVEVRQP
jgi:hypothetical protein